MKKTITYALIVITANFLIIGLANAGCCVSQCLSSASSLECAQYGDFDERECSEIDSCNTPEPSPNPDGTTECGEGFESDGMLCWPAETGLSEKPLVDIIRNFLDWILLIMGFLAMIAFVISGLQYLTAAGSENQIESAKRNMKWSIIGVAVALSAYIIIKAVSVALNATDSFF